MPEIRKMRNAIRLSEGKASERDHVKKKFHYFVQGDAKLKGELKCSHNAASSLPVGASGECLQWSIPKAI